MTRGWWWRISRLIRSFLFTYLLLELLLRAAVDGSCVMQHALNMHYERMRAAEHALRGPFNLLERRHEDTSRSQ